MVNYCNVFVLTVKHRALELTCSVIHLPAMVYTGGTFSAYEP